MPKPPYIQMGRSYSFDEVPSFPTTMTMASSFSAMNSFNPVVEEEADIIDTSTDVDDRRILGVNADIERKKRWRDRFLKQRVKSFDSGWCNLQNLEGAERQRVFLELYNPTYSSYGVQMKIMGKDLVFSYVQSGLPFAEAGVGFGDVLLSIEGCDCALKKLSQVLKILEKPVSNSFTIEVLQKKFEIAVTAVPEGDWNLQLLDSANRPLGSVSYVNVAKTRRILGYDVIAINDMNMLNVGKDMFVNTLFKNPRSPKKLRLMNKEVVKSLVNEYSRIKDRSNSHLAGATDHTKNHVEVLPASLLPQ